MAQNLRPKTDVIEKIMAGLVGRGNKYADRQALAHAILKAWRDRHLSTADLWSHGVGKKLNSVPPNPNQTNPAATLRRYIHGTTQQNLLGWQMFADLLFVGIAEIIEIQGEGRLEVTQAGSFDVAMTPGSLPLHKLANIDVGRPSPIGGANMVFADQDKEQSISLSARAIFNTIRGEELVAEDGEVIASADIELTYAHIIIRLNDPYVSVVGGIGTQGAMQLGDVHVAYLGTHQNSISFEIAAIGDRRSLSGVVQSLENLVQLRGRFSEEDYVGIIIEPNGILLPKLKFEDSGSKDFVIKHAIKTQLLTKGIRHAIVGGSESEQCMTAKRYFMKALVHASEQ